MAGDPRAGPRTAAAKAGQEGSEMPALSRYSRGPVVASNGRGVKIVKVPRAPFG
jgi:hypothetical protein